MKVGWGGFSPVIFWRGAHIMGQAADCRCIELGGGGEGKWSRASGAGTTGVGDVPELACKTSWRRNAMYTASHETSQPASQLEWSCLYIIPALPLTSPASPQPYPSPALPLTSPASPQPCPLPARCCLCEAGRPPCWASVWSRGGCACPGWRRRQRSSCGRRRLGRRRPRREQWYRTAAPLWWMGRR